MERYEIMVKLTGGSTYNFNNEDGTECKVGDIIKLHPKAHNRGNAIKAVKQILNFAHVNYEIL